jgi:hypothetical protein
MVTVQLTEAEIGEIGIALWVLKEDETTPPSRRPFIKKLMDKLGNIAIEDMRKKYELNKED